MQVNDDMVRAAAEVFCDNGIHIALPQDGDLDDLERERYDTLRAALTAALAAMWRPAESESNGLLYFPKKVTGHHRQSCLPEMMNVGHASDFPNRQPTHFMPLPSPPKAEG